MPNTRLKKAAPNSPSLQSTPAPSPAASPQQTSLRNPATLMSPTQTPPIASRTPPADLVLSPPEPDRKRAPVTPTRNRQPTTERIPEPTSEHDTILPDIASHNDEDAFISKRDAPEGVRPAARRQNSHAKAMLGQSRVSPQQPELPMGSTSTLSSSSNIQSGEESGLLSPRSRIRGGFVPALPLTLLPPPPPPVFDLSSSPQIKVELAPIRKSRDSAEQGDGARPPSSPNMPPRVPSPNVLTSLDVQHFPSLPPPPPPLEVPTRRKSSSFCAYEELPLPPPPPLSIDGRLTASTGDISQAGQKWKQEKRHSQDMPEDNICFQVK